MRYLLSFILIIFFFNPAFATGGKWASKVTGNDINYVVTDSKAPLKDFAGNYITVVYLENLNVKKIGRYSNKQNVAWLAGQGYRVIELDYAHDQRAAALNINTDIIAINHAIAAGSFCNLTNSSHYQSYILLEGYRIARNVPYFKDDPKVYNTPEQYTAGDSLYMDIIYPANPSKRVPVVLSFSYSNSYATYNASKRQLTDENKNERLKLEYTLSAFNDSFLEAAPANGLAWAIADHPKYCPWAKGQPPGGRVDTYKSYEANPDAARKVKSAVRTLRSFCGKNGLSGKIGIFGFSRGSTAGSMAVGDKHVKDIEQAGFNIGVSDKVQAAALGPGVFDYTRIYTTLNDGDTNLETRCVWAWGDLKENYALWQSMGSASLVQSAAAAPVLFFYNTDDDHYYQDQIASFKAKLDSLHVPTTTLVDYGHGHAIPQTATALNQLYQFFRRYLKPPAVNL